jgi:hypothetical protein
LLDVPWWLRRVHRAAVRLAVEYDVLHLAEGGADILDCHRHSTAFHTQGIRPDSSFTNQSEHRET